MRWNGEIMIKLALKYVSIILTIYILSQVIDSVHVGSTAALLVMGLVLLAVNLVLKPLLLLVTLPFSIITLGLFSLIVNTWTIMIADSFVSKVSMGGFLNSLLAAFIIVIFDHLLRGLNRAESRL
jgi:putative membrane protein